ATGCCLLALAILLSGVGLTVSAAPVEQPLANKDEPKKDETKKDETKKDDAKKDESKKENPDPRQAISSIQQRLKEVQLERQKAVEKMNEEMQRLQAELSKNMTQFPGQFRAINGVADADGGVYPGFLPHDVRLG